MVIALSEVMKTYFPLFAPLELRSSWLVARRISRSFPLFSLRKLWSFGRPSRTLNGLASGWFAFGLMCLWLHPSTTSAQEVLRAYRSVDGLFLSTSQGTYALSRPSENAVEVYFTPVAPHADAKRPSHAVQHAHLNMEFTQNSDGWIWSDDHWEVQIQRAPFAILFSYDGRRLLEDSGQYWEDEGDFYRYQKSFNITPNEVLYGGGARVLGMNRRGEWLELYNRAHYGYETRAPLMNYTMPLMLSSQGYGLHLDNTFTGFIDLDTAQNNRITYGASGGPMRYQVIAASHWPGLTQSIADLLGHQPLPPRWALGNFASRFGYHSQEEVLRTVRLYREQHIPLDAVVLDLYWFGKSIFNTLGNFKFDADSFPHPEEMVRELSDLCVEPVTITEPFVIDSSSNYTSALKADVLGKHADGTPYFYDFYFGHTGLIDLFNPEGRTWFQKVYSYLNDLGITAVWGDLGEPEVHPRDLWHSAGWNVYQPADAVHNIYGHEWAQLIVEGLAENRPNLRPFVLMRAGYSGTQKFGILPWSGDVNRSWGGLRGQPEIALQMGLQGLGYMHSDVGGFAGAKRDSDLFLRWHQYGVFQPIFRPHAQEEVPSELVYWDPETRHYAAEAIALRYRLLPYNYALVYQNHLYGWPLQRPLFFSPKLDFHRLQSQRYAEMDSVFLWGSDLLVVPVLDSARASVTAYFPEDGSKWVAWNNPEDSRVGSAARPLECEVSLDRIPVFVRLGAVIPTSRAIEQTDAFNLDSLELTWYYDYLPESYTTTVYHDDGRSIDSDLPVHHDEVRISWSGRFDGGTGLTIEPNLDFSGGARVHLTLVNRSRAEVEVIMKDLEGDQVLAGSIAPGSSIRMPLKLTDHEVLTLRINPRGRKND